MMPKNIVQWMRARLSGWIFVFIVAPSTRVQFLFRDRPESALSSSNGRRRVTADGVSRNRSPGGSYLAKIRHALDDDERDWRSRLLFNH